MSCRSESSPLSSALHSATVVFLYTYPTLLVKLVPLLDRLTDGSHKVRAVVTLTYHLPEGEAKIEKENTKYDLRMYTRIQRPIDGTE
jgi:hypothetical protein